ncbi:TBC1 domain family member 31 [Bufo gargarizans]|uniref:TBC1 domain family member 31 n=1 Tax=Bufo gargarizans TaxID=30331 RepID=UPI001CF4D0BC|nr:TBC1 domain family member 31 [Bufo gargarizans]XP_044149305.1 TBC1 domain family member 31 [Bufo gargarizans]
MQTTDLGSKETGKIWHRKPTPSANDGIIVNVLHGAGGSQAKTMRFLQVAFDSSGDCFLAGDHLGSIYLFNLNRNRFDLVQRTQQACTALAFNLHRKSEFLVALADYSVKCFDTDNKELVSWMRGHDSTITSISVHGSGRYGVTTSSETAQLWDLDTFQRKRKLNVLQSVGIQKVFFLPLSNTILSCFKDNSIFAWESDTLTCKYQLPAPEGGSVFQYKAFAITRDGRMLAAGGKSNNLHLWCLSSKQLFRIIQMPSTVRSVRQLEFLPDSFDGGSSQVLGVLSQDGIMRFINIQTCKLVFDIGSHDEGIVTSSVSPNGRYIASILENGSINLYNVQALTKEINKPPPPLVKVVDLTKDKDSTANKSGTTSEKVNVSAGRPCRPWKSKQEVVKTKYLQPDECDMSENKENELQSGLSKPRLRAILKGFGEYPAKYRMFIWRSLLQLPENHAAFSSLTDKGTHPQYVLLHQEYPLKSRKLLRVLQRTLSTLAHWSAIFGETKYLPLLAFPFVKLFQNNQLICFEVVATVITNWCQHWFEYFPNPPINILGMAENVLAHHDKELLQHFVKYDVTSQVYAWPLLETLFSEVLTREEWLKLFDNVFSNHPAFLLMAVVSYILCSRSPLLHCSQKEDFEYFFHHRNNLDISAMIKEAYHVMDATPAEIHPQHLLNDFVPLTKGQYPVFNKYPKFIVDYQSQERERIRQEELEYLRERQISHEMEAEALRRRAEDEAWYQQQELLQGAEQQRRQLLIEEEQRLLQQRQRLAAVKRELKIKELQLLEAARKRFMKYQQDQRKMELRRLDDEIERKMCVRERETATVVQDVEIRQMELEAQRRFYEQQLAKELEAEAQDVKGDLDASRRKAHLEEQMFWRLMETEEDLKDKKLLEESLAKADRLCSETEWKLQALHKQKQDDVQRGKHYEDVAKLAESIKEQEKQLCGVIKELEARKWAEVSNRQSQLETEQLLKSTADAERRKFLHAGMVQEVQPQDVLQETESDYSDRLGDLNLCSPDQISVQGDKEVQSKPQNVCLNDVSSSSSSAHFSLDRGRDSLDYKERALMSEVRELRHKLASQAQRKYRTSHYPDTQWT